MPSVPAAMVGLGVVIVAAGSGTRFGDTDKALAPLAGEPLLRHSLDIFLSFDDVTVICLVLASHTMDAGLEIVGAVGDPRVVACLGGATRGESVLEGLQAMPSDTALVVVHDAARPLVQRDLVERVVAAARRTGAAIPAVPVADTIHRMGADRTMTDTMDRSSLRAAQTPQVARMDWLRVAYARGGDATDEGGLLHAAGFPVTIVDGDVDNIKITWPRDLAVAELLLAERRVAR